MKRGILLFLSTMLLGMSSVGNLEFPKQEKQELAWWSLTCERPNPEKLPVQIQFKWLKGLE